MPTNDKEEHNCTQCPWWRRLYGLRSFSAVTLIGDGETGYLDLSFWPLQHGDIIAIPTDSVRSLNLEGTNLLKECSLLHIAENWQGCPLLHLNLAGCAHVTNASCDAIGRHFTNLKEINLNDCSNVCDKGIADLMRCKYLEEIYLRNIYRLGDRGLLCIRENMIVMKLVRVLGG